MIMVCNNCSYNHQFISGHTQVFICHVCKGIQQRGVSNREVSPTLVAVPDEDMSPVQLGTVVIQNKAEYRVLGRWAYRFNSGSRNKWLMINENDEPFYLIESAGFYAVCQKDKRKLNNSDLLNIKPSEEFEIEDDYNVYLDTISRNAYTFYEGELNSIALDQKDFFAFDFSNVRGRYVFAQLHTKDHIELYMGWFHSFTELQFKNLRKFNVWS